MALKRAYTRLAISRHQSQRGVAYLKFLKNTVSVKMVGTLRGLVPTIFVWDCSYLFSANIIALLYCCPPRIAPLIVGNIELNYLITEWTVAVVVRLSTVLSIDKPMVITEPTVPRRSSSGFETVFSNLVPRALFTGQGKAPWGRGCVFWQNGARA